MPRSLAGTLPPRQDGPGRVEGAWPGHFPDGPAVVVAALVEAGAERTNAEAGYLITWLRAHGAQSARDLV